MPCRCGNKSATRGWSSYLPRKSRRKRRRSRQRRDRRSAGETDGISAQLRRASTGVCSRLRWGEPGTDQNFHGSALTCWPRSLRRSILAWPTPPRAHDDDRIRLPTKPPPRRGERGKKESAKDHPSRHSPRSAVPSSPFSLARDHIEALTAAEGFAARMNLPK
jgi:hypothetical protein